MCLFRIGARDKKKLFRIGVRDENSLFRIRGMRKQFVQDKWDEKTVCSG